MTLRKRTHIWSGKMTKTTKRLNDLEKRICELEMQIKSQSAQPQSDSAALSFKEVIDEWINGKDTRGM